MSDESNILAELKRHIDVTNQSINQCKENIKLMKAILKDGRESGDNDLLNNMTTFRKHFKERMDNGGILIRASQKLNDNPDNSMEGRASRKLTKVMTQSADTYAECFDLSNKIITMLLATKGNDETAH